MLLCTLLAEKYDLKGETELGNTCTCNILAICKEMTKAYDDEIGLRHMLYICKAKKITFKK